MNPVRTSIFELLKIGPGPSSSHTIGPMAAGLDFVRLAEALSHDDLAAARRIEVRLMGSLAATGRGHGTNRAVVAGLMGVAPEDCTSKLLDSLAHDEEVRRSITIGQRSLPFAVSEVIFDTSDSDLAFANTMTIALLGTDDRTIVKREYHSVGGGFIQWDGWTAPERGLPAYPYASMAELLAIEEREGMPMHDILLANEMASTGASERDVLAGLDNILEAMRASVAAGLKATGRLPGSLGVQRKAVRFMEHANTVGEGKGRLFILMNAFALAASEENAAGHRIVTAPTSGAAGVLPSVVECLTQTLGTGQTHLREGLLAAAGVGMLCKHNASIAGADVGCQGEVGTATAMGAAMFTYARGSCSLRASNAAEVGLEHQLGMTCDPVGGYVQIPCIERNAMGVVKAYNASLIALTERPANHRVPLDATIRAMAETGRDMNCKYKETSRGGLAVSMVAC